RTPPPVIFPYTTLFRSTTPFNTEHLEELVDRVATARNPEQLIPADIIFTVEELERAHAEIRAIELPREVVHALGFLLGQLDFCRDRKSTRLNSSHSQIS